MKVAGFQYDENTRQWTSMSGVNMTLGLPIALLSTTVSPSAKLEKAGRIRKVCMIEAIKMAAQLCE